MPATEGDDSEVPSTEMAEMSGYARFDELNELAGGRLAVPCRYAATAASWCGARRNCHAKPPPDPLHATGRDGSPSAQTVPPTEVTYGDPVGNTGNWKRHPTSLRARPIADPDGKGSNDQCDPPSPDDPNTVTPRSPSIWKPAEIASTCASLRYMHTCRCSCMKAWHRSCVKPCLTTSSQSRLQDAAERDPSEIESTCGKVCRVGNSRTKSSSAAPKPSPSSVDADVLVFETMVCTLSPNDAIIRTSRLPSPKLSPPSVP
mmetsp:Transcript_35241/g.92196  ORF Transcript_35241/g.92196 Transcript_35241/m.92196 type:complete len:260 (+) Transcript_35241:499-1278(+)